MVTTFNLFTTISWVITGLLSTILSIMFLEKNPKKRLNQLFFAGLINWSISIILNGIVFTVAYKSLITANIIRDISLVLFVLGVFILFIAAYGIYFGVESINWILFVISFVIAGLIIGFGIANDWVTIDGFGGFKTTDNIIGKICIQILSVLVIVISDIIIFLTYRSSKNPQAKKRVGYFVIGYTTIIFGFVIFLIDGIIDSFISFPPYVFPPLALVTWVIAPILMLIGFNVRSDIQLTPLSKEILLKKESQIIKAEKEQKIERFS
ncbi:MAG: hypothetical protein FK731_14740 [Asgard group archaeon]|nr:hypothetical protein [Asgard group archaeon]